MRDRIIALVRRLPTVPRLQSLGVGLDEHADPDPAVQGYVVGKFEEKTRLLPQTPADGIWRRVERIRDYLVIRRADSEEAAWAGIERHDGDDLFGAPASRELFESRDERCEFSRVGQRDVAVTLEQYRVITRHEELAAEIEYSLDRLLYAAQIESMLGVYES